MEKFPTYNFALIMGEDNLNPLHKWKNYEAILENHDILCLSKFEFRREIDEAVYQSSKNSSRMGAPVIELSSTFIRDSIKLRQKYLTRAYLKNVWAYIRS
jgi:nicotinate-nucleotide adenylyltransferase